MTYRGIGEKAKALMSARVLCPNTWLRRDLGADDLALIEFVMDLEQRFELEHKLEIPVDDLEDITLGNLIEQIKKQSPLPL